MEATKPLHEQLVECEQWCSARTEKEYLQVATKGLRVLPEHHAELATPLPGQEPRADGWLLRSDVIGFGNWLLIGFMILVAGVIVFLAAFELVQKTGYPILYASGLSVVPIGLLMVLPLRMILRRHELVFGDDAMIVRRRIFGRVNQEWRLTIAGEVRVGLAYRGVQARVSSESGGRSAQLSAVVASGGEEIVFGTDLDHAERARLAILIDHFYNGIG